MKKSYQAFTLLEVILVTALLGIIFSLVFPSVNRLADLAHLDLIGRQVLGRARLAQCLALANSANCALVWDLEGPAPIEYQLILTKIDGEAANFGRYALPGNFTVSTNFPGQALNFTSAGTPSRSGTITLTSPRGQKRYVIASSIGRLRLASQTE